MRTLKARFVGRRVRADSPSAAVRRIGAAANGGPGGAWPRRTTPVLQVALAPRRRYAARRALRLASRGPDEWIRRRVASVAGLPRRRRGGRSAAKISCQDQWRKGAGRRGARFNGSSATTPRAQHPPRARVTLAPTCARSHVSAAEPSPFRVFQRTIEAGRATLWYGAAGSHADHRRHARRNCEPGRDPPRPLLRGLLVDARRSRLPISTSPETPARPGRAGAFERITTRAGRRKHRDPERARRGRA